MEQSRGDHAYASIWLHGDMHARRDCLIRTHICTFFPSKRHIFVSTYTNRCDGIRRITMGVQVNSSDKVAKSKSATKEGSSSSPSNKERKRGVVIRLILGPERD